MELDFNTQAEIAGAIDTIRRSTDFSGDLNALEKELMSQFQIAADKRPARPFIPTAATGSPEDFRKYADDLADWQIRIARYKDVTKYNNSVAATIRHEIIQRIIKPFSVSPLYDLVDRLMEHLIFQLGSDAAHDLNVYRDRYNEFVDIVSQFQITDL